MVLLGIAIGYRCGLSACGVSGAGPFLCMDPAGAGYLQPQQTSDLFARHDINRRGNGYPNRPIVKASFLYTPENISKIWEIILSQLYLREVFGGHDFLIVHVLSFQFFE